MAYIEASRAKVGAKIDIEIRGQKFPAVIEKKPLYKKPSLPSGTAAATTSAAKTSP